MGKQLEKRMARLEHAKQAAKSLCFERFYDPEHPQECACPQPPKGGASGGLDSFYRWVEDGKHEQKT